MEKKAVVLGGSGFIGGHLAESLYKRGYNVAVLDIYEPKGFNWKGNFFNIDILDTKLLEKTISKYRPNVIYECSGILGTAETFAHIDKTVDVNIKGVLNTLEIARKYLIPLIYVGLTNRWLNPYTITKRAAENFCLMYAKEFNLKITVAKGLNAYGPRQHWKKVRKIAPTFITRALENKPLVINGSGNQVVDMVHTDDLSEILVRIFEKGTCWGLSIDAGTGIPMTVNEVAQNIIKYINSKSRITHNKMRRGEPKISVTLADPAPVKQLLNYYPQVSFEKGIKQTINWYKKNYKTFE